MNEEKPLDGTEFIDAEPVATIELDPAIVKPLTNAMLICAKVATLYKKNNGTAPNFTPIEPVASYKRRKPVSVAYHNYLCPKCYKPFLGPLANVCTCSVPKPKKAEEAA